MATGMEIPEVHRWAYDYGKDGREFIPQTEPLGEMRARLEAPQPSEGGLKV